MRIGMLTGGGDCPGLNAVIRAVVHKGVLHYGDEFIGFMEGWRGVLDDRTMPLSMKTMSGMLHRGGTILRSSRTNVKKIPGGFEQCLKVIQDEKLDALIAMGGDDTQSISVELAKRGVNCVGLPKTIDNDLSGTDACFGFDTAVMIATEAVDRLHSTTEAHSRVQGVEVMGRDAGWIAVTAGIAGGAGALGVRQEGRDRRRGRGRKVPEHRGSGDGGRQAGLVRARTTERDRAGAGGGDREAHGLRDTQREPGAHPARRDSDSVRPDAGDTLWHRGDRHGA